MSKRLLKKRTYSWKEFKAASRLERIHIHMMHPSDFYLHDNEMQHLDRMRTAFSVLSSSLSRLEAVKKLTDLIPEISRTSIYTLINDTKDVFGRMLQVNKEFDRFAVGEKLLDLYRMNLEDGDYEECRKCLEAYAKLHKLDQEEVAALENIQLPDLVFTSDPSALPGVEDAEVEEE